MKRKHSSLVKISRQRSAGKNQQVEDQRVKIMKMTRFCTAVLSLILCAFNLSAQTRPPATSSTVYSTLSGEKEQDIRRQTFEIVWHTVKEKHFDPDYGGVDWDRVREQ
jgi:hypothetical protein